MFYLVLTEIIGFCNLQSFFAQKNYTDIFKVLMNCDPHDCGTSFQNYLAWRDFQWQKRDSLRGYRVIRIIKLVWLTARKVLKKRDSYPVCKPNKYYFRTLSKVYLNIHSLRQVWTSPTGYEVYDGKQVCISSGNANKRARLTAAHVLNLERLAWP